MKALILKDLYVILNQKNSLLMLITLFVIASFFLGDTGMLLIFLTVLSMTLINITLSNDETSHWNRFVNTLPIEKSDIVKSKYILSLILILFMVIIVFPIFLLTNMITKTFTMVNFISILSIIISGILMMLSFVIPVTIKYGAQKARIFILALIFIPVIVINVISNGSFFHQLLEFLLLFGYIALIIAVVMFYLSYQLSVKFFKKKEY
ncbi:ABC-2 transporter permease [Ureibacillus sp. FSL W8-0352]|uniref:ABC-2 transporter permease n=1 Tax=Ureibacillus sp. FSL W8-0352 TaxID=2954596 RepID=UPI0030FC4255